MTKSLFHHLYLKQGSREMRAFFNEKGTFLIILKRYYGIFVHLKIIPFLYSKYGFACVFSSDHTAVVKTV